MSDIVESIRIYRSKYSQHVGRVGEGSPLIFLKR